MNKLIVKADIFARCFIQKAVRNTKALVRKEDGQGTTEYAILVGVLVVIAIIAITLFRPKIQELWDSIASGINGL
ncbi:MAG: Flp family type IVb pilin [Anaerotardibacter sp.]